MSFTALRAHAASRSIGRGRGLRPQSVLLYGGVGHVGGLGLGYHGVQQYQQFSKAAEAIGPTDVGLGTGGILSKTAKTEDTKAHFKVQSHDVAFARLAGGILSRCEQGHETVIEAMGHKAISNSIRALVFANDLARDRRSKAEVLGKVMPSAPICLAFTPFFAAKDEMRWMRLTVVPLSYQPTPLTAAGEPLRVSAKTDYKGLVKAINARWKKRAVGAVEREDVVIAAMGAESVSLCVKSMAHALKDLNGQPGVRPFVCFPANYKVRQSGDGAEETEVVEQVGKGQIVTYFALKKRPRSQGWDRRGNIGSPSSPSRDV